MRNCANIIYIDVVLLFLSLIILSSLILHKKEEFVNRVLKSVVELNSDLGISKMSAGKKQTPQFSISGNNRTTLTITFPEPLDFQPDIVIAQTVMSTIGVLASNPVNNAQFQVVIYNYLSDSYENSVQTIQWIAIKY